MNKYGGKRQFIYLAGNISKDNRTYQWREVFADLMKHDPVVILNPCDNAFNRQYRELHRMELEDEACKLVKDSQGILRLKDFQMVKIASVVVMNLVLFELDRPMVGTIVEHTWAVDVLNVPIIGIVGDGKGPYSEHSWLTRPLAAMVEDIEEAVYVIRRYFL
ncbi:unnamed protein product [marine sediment metagenome]|uniref:Nucleoside 2-deoxyribosyltransferase n=1 Tax=marine sediment metagenome TaxID=412755 RepID=X0WPW4_9ZZZZ